MKSIADLFEKYHKESVTKVNRRGELLEYFSGEIKRTIQYIAVRLSHYSLSELDALKSAYGDRLARNGKVAAHKYFWWITKTK